MKKTNRLCIVKEKDSKNFIKIFNEHKVSEAFIVSCEKAGKLFKQGKNK